MVYDDEMMDLMLSSGCLGNVIGFESVDRSALEAARKTPNLAGFDVYEKEI